VNYIDVLTFVLIVGTASWFWLVVAAAVADAN
jgi:hypothetical protein